MDAFVTFIEAQDVISMLQAFEVLQRINFGGERMLHVPKTIGGKRIVDAMGRDGADIQWIFTF